MAKGIPPPDSNPPPSVDPDEAYARQLAEEWAAVDRAERELQRQRAQGRGRGKTTSRGRGNVQGPSTNINPPSSNYDEDMARAIAASLALANPISNNRNEDSMSISPPPKASIPEEVPWQSQAIDNIMRLGGHHQNMQNLLNANPSYQAILRVMPTAEQIVWSANSYTQQRIQTMSDIPEHIPPFVLNGWPIEQIEDSQTEFNQMDDNNHWIPEQPMAEVSRAELVGRTFIPMVDWDFQRLSDAYQNMASELTSADQHQNVNDRDDFLRLASLFSRLNTEELRIFLVLNLVNIRNQIENVMEDKHKSRISIDIALKRGIGLNFSRNFIDFLRNISDYILLIALEWAQTLTGSLIWNRELVEEAPKFDPNHEKYLNDQSNRLARSYRSASPEEQSRVTQMNEVLTPYFVDHMDEIRERQGQFEALMPYSRNVILDFSGFEDATPIVTPQTLEQNGHLDPQYGLLLDNLNLVAFIVDMQEAAFDLESVISPPEEGGIPNALQELNEVGLQIEMSDELEEYLRATIRLYYNMAYQWTMYLRDSLQPQLSGPESPSGSPPTAGGRTPKMIPHSPVPQIPKFNIRYRSRSPNRTPSPTRFRDRSESPYIPEDSAGAAFSPVSSASLPSGSSPNSPKGEVPKMGIESDDDYPIEDLVGFMDSTYGKVKTPPRSHLANKRAAQSDTYQGSAKRLRRSTSRETADLRSPSSPRYSTGLSSSSSSARSSPSRSSTRSSSRSSAGSSSSRSSGGSSSSRSSAGSSSSRSSGGSSSSRSSAGSSSSRSSGGYVGNSPSSSSSVRSPARSAGTPSPNLTSSPTHSAAVNQSESNVQEIPEQDIEKAQQEDDDAVAMLLWSISNDD